MNDFVDIPGYPGYKINRKGECIGLMGWILKPNKLQSGYLHYSLCVNGLRKGMKVHRLVALTFIPNPLNLATVNHKDENKENNCIDNLEWMTQSENTRRASKNVNGKCYYSHRIGWQVCYRIGVYRHTKVFKHEDDAAFYVSLLKAIYPRF